MKMSHVNPGLRAIGLGLAFACLGFSLAVATSGDAGGRGTGLGHRAISTNCVRAPVTFVTNADLGVVVVGTHFTRQILVQFGFKPHIFLFGAEEPSSSLSLSETGTLSGEMSETGTETFEVRVFDPALDFSATPARRLFSITGVESMQDPNLPLQFVSNAALPDAVANEPYTFTLHANGGTTPYVGFSFPTSADLAALPVGLALNSTTGEIFGKPVVPTAAPAKFDIICIDDVGTVTRRTFSLTVLPGTISSDFIATSGSFKLNFGAEGNADSLKLTILLNKTFLAHSKIRKASDLNGVAFDMDFGGVQVPGQLVKEGTTGTTGAAETLAVKFDKNGSIKFPDVLKGDLPVKGEKLRYQITLDPVRGILKVNMTGVSMIKSLHANFSTFKDPVIPVNIRIGAAAAPATTTTTTSTTDTTDPNTTINVDSTDVIKFLYRRKGNTGRGSALANTKVPPGGLFLISKVSGVEVKTGPVVDRVIMKFGGIIRGIGGAPIKFNTGDTVAVLLANTCMGDFPATSLKASGDKLTFRNDDTSAGLANFVIDNKKGTIYFDTHPILPGPIFLQDILNGGEALVVPVTITITAPGAMTPSFDGQSSVTVFRRGGHIQNK